MPEGRFRNVASEDDKVTEVRCKCGSVWVRPGHVADWRCRCHGKSVGETITLGPKGALP